MGNIATNMPIGLCCFIVYKVQQTFSYQDILHFWLISIKIQNTHYIPKLLTQKIKYIILSETDQNIVQT